MAHFPSSQRKSDSIKCHLDTFSLLRLEVEGNHRRTAPPFEAVSHEKGISSFSLKPIILRGEKALVGPNLRLALAYLRSKVTKGVPQITLYVNHVIVNGNQRYRQSISRISFEIDRGIILLSFSDFSLSKYSAWFWVEIEASHHQVHNEFIALLILFVYLSIIDNRHSQSQGINCSAHAHFLLPRYYDLLLPCPSKGLSSLFKSFRRRIAGSIGQHL